MIAVCMGMTRGRCETCDNYKGEITGRWCAHWCRNANVCPPDGYCHGYSCDGEPAPPTYVYAFPANNRRGFAYEQLKHAAGEIVEATAEITEDSMRCAIEVLDAIECLEGALRDLEDGGTDLSAAWAAHRAKNSARGDYD